MNRKPVTLSMIGVIALGLAISLPCGSVNAESIPGLFNTGVDENGTSNGVPLADNDVDTHYELIEPSLIVGPAIVATSAGAFPIPPWLDDNEISAWITPSEDTSGPGDFELVPSYYYRTTFDLTGLDPATAEISGQWSSDNSGLDILLNETSTGFENEGQFGGWSEFTLSAADGHPFVRGINTLDFVVNNGAGEDNTTGPTGVRVEMTGSAEPGDGFLLGDVNLDGLVNGLDVDPFVDVLLNGPYQIEADMNSDGEVNGLDVDPFVAEVVGGGVESIPEPSTLALLVIAALAGLLARRRAIG